MKMPQISMELTEKQLAIIDAGAEADLRSRTSFMVFSAIKRARELGVVDAEQSE